MRRALAYGLLASLFFAFTFIFNRSMNLDGGYWLWSAALRFIFMLPIMGVIVWKQKGIKAVLEDVKREPVSWVLWSTVGFGFFYMPLSMASVYGESWFVAATWQITIVAGALLTPLFGKRIPIKNLICSAIILGGIFLLQVSHFKNIHTEGLVTALLLIIVAGFSYPLGNRKMLQHCPPELSTVQRVFGMNLCSMPFWIICSIYALRTHGMPSGGQIFQSIIVAIFSGVIATILFFEATNMVKNNPKHLAIIEATQSGDAMPAGTGFAGILVIITGMVLNSFSG